MVTDEFLGFAKNVETFVFLGRVYCIIKNYLQRMLQNQIKH